MFEAGGWRHNPRVQAQTLAAWLKTRLTQSATQAQWTTLVQGAVRHALSQPLSQAMPEALLLETLQANLRPEQLADAARFVVREGLSRVVHEAQADEAPVSRWLDEGAQARLLDFVARPGWADKAWVDQLFQEKAMEALVSDTLYRALRDFSTLVPRIVQGVLPSGLGKLAKLGGKATGGVGGRVFDEVEKKLEAEIKRFLDMGTRRALERAAAFTSERLDSPESAQAQRDLAGFALAQTGAFHARPFDAPTLEALEGVAVAAAESVAVHPELHPSLARVVGRFYAERGGVPMQQALAAAGVDTAGFDVKSWAAAAWPAVQQAFEAPEVEAFLLELAGEILAEIEKEGS